MRVIYVAGPYRGADSWEVERNIRRAEELAFEVWRMGLAALCPHMNTRHFDRALPDQVWLDGDLELLRRCDGLILTADWERSAGTITEVARARSLGLPVFLSLDYLLIAVNKERRGGAWEGIKS